MAETTAGPAPPQAGANDQPTAEQAKQKAGEVKDQAQEKAQEAAGQAKGRARDEIDRRSTDAGEKVSTTASDVRSVADSLREQGKEGPAKIAEQAADRAEKLGGYLKESDADRILGDVEDFARRQPWAVVAGGLAIGFAASRFLKASSSQRYQQRSPGTSTGYAGNAGVGTTGGHPGTGVAGLERRATPTEGISASGATFTDPGVTPPPATGVTPPQATGVSPSAGVVPPAGA